MKSISFYSFSVDWYNEYEDKDQHTNGIVAANSLTEAVEKIAHRLPYADNLLINQLDDWDFIFLNNENYDLVQREGIGAFDLGDTYREVL